MENDVNNEYPFTSNRTYDKLVISFLVFRGVICSFFFILNLPQCFYEYYYLKSKKGKLYSPRLFTFIAITLFPLFRALHSFVCVATIDMRTGSESWYLSILGTCFFSCEFIYIGMNFISILYTFFITDKIALNNIKRSWIMANSFTAISFLWTFSLMIVVKELGPLKTKSISSNGFIVMISIMGTFILINGFVLILYLKKQNSKTHTFKKSLNRIIKLTLILFVILVGFILRNIISAVLKIKSSSNSNYIFMFVTFLLEIPQIAVVMTALNNSSDNCWKKYITFKRVVKVASIELPKDTSFKEDINSNNVQRNNSLLNIKTSKENDGIEKNSYTISAESNNSSGVNSSNSNGINDFYIEMNNIKE